MAFLWQFFVCSAVLFGLVNSLPNIQSKISDGDLRYYCPREDSILELYPHPNCERYYKLQLEYTLEVHCPIETHFNKRTNCCENYEHAQCVYGKAPLRPEAISEIPVDEEPALPPVEGEGANMESYICSEEHKEGSYFELYPHPNCGRFYEIRQGTTYEMMCLNGLEWNRNSNCCDEPRLSNCIFGMGPYRPNAVGL